MCLDQYNLLWWLGQVTGRLRQYSRAAEWCDFDHLVWEWCKNSFCSRNWHFSRERY
jgi:hypothetical protein